MLESFQINGEHQVFDAQLLHSGEKYSYKYFFIVDQGHNLIDWTKTEFKILSSLDQSVVKFVKISSYKEFWDLIQEVGNNDKSQRVELHSFCLKNGQINSDIFRIHHICNGYYVSERLKLAIEEAGLTGMRFTPINEIKYI